MPRSEPSLIHGVPARAARLYDEDENPADIDPYVRALRAIDVLHAQTHAGIVYGLDHVFAAVADDGFAYIMVTPGPGPMHFRVEVASGGDAYAWLYEDPSASDGTPLTPRNKNRLAADESAAEVVHTPTVSMSGTQIVTAFVPGGARNQATGGSANFEEIILAPGKTYLVAVQNKSGVAQDLSIHLTWYEP